MSDQHDHDDTLLAELRALPTAPPSRALSARVLERAHAALAAGPSTTPARAGRRLATSWAVGSTVVAAVVVYVTWAVDFLARLADT